MDNFDLNAFLEDAQVAETPAQVVEESSKKSNGGLIFGLGVVTGMIIWKITEYIRYEYGSRSLNKLRERFCPPQVDFDPDATEDDSEFEETTNNDNN